MRLKIAAWTASISALFFLALPVNAAVVPGHLLGVFSGNDTVAALFDNLGLDATFLARVNTPSSINASSLSNDGLMIDNFSLNSDNEALSGQWSYSGPAIANIIVLKANGFHAVYLFNDTITSGMPNIGLWDTSQLDNKGLSHITAYSVVPLPAAVWLFASGLLGVGFMRRKTV